MSTAVVTKRIGHRVRVCGRCQTSVYVFEVRAGYLSDPYWGDYLCGGCACVVRPA